MTEKEMYERIVALRNSVEDVIKGALALPATIELCVFTGKLSGVLDILEHMEEAGVPVHAPDEKPHPLGQT